MKTLGATLVGVNTELNQAHAAHPKDIEACQDPKAYREGLVHPPPVQQEVLAVHCSTHGTGGTAPRSGGAFQPQPRLVRCAHSFENT